MLSVPDNHTSRRFLWVSFFFSFWVPLIRNHKTCSENLAFCSIPSPKLTYPLFKVNFESMIFPNFQRWDMWSFPGGYILSPPKQSLKTRTVRSITCLRFATQFCRYNRLMDLLGNGEVNGSLGRKITYLSNGGLRFACSMLGQNKKSLPSGGFNGSWPW